MVSKDHQTKYAERYYEWDCTCLLPSEDSVTNGTKYEIVFGTLEFGFEGLFISWWHLSLVIFYWRRQISIERFNEEN